MSPAVNLEFLGIVLIAVAYTRNTQYSLSHHIFHGLKFIIPPTDDEIDRARDPPKSKRSKSSPKQRNVFERLELIGLQSCTLTMQLVMGKDSIISRQVFWDQLHRSITAALICFLIHIWSESYRCIQPVGIEGDWSTILALLTIFISLGCNIIGLFKDKVSRTIVNLKNVVAFAVAVCSTIILLLFCGPPDSLPFVRINSSYVQSQVELTAQHLYSVLGIISPVKLNTEGENGIAITIIQSLCMASVSLLVLLVIVSTVAPAIRLSHSLLLLTGGSAAERGPIVLRMRLWAELFLPAGLGLTLLALGPSFGSRSTGEAAGSPLPVTRCAVAASLLIFVRVLNIRPLLQSSLDRAGSEIALAVAQPEIDSLSLQIAVGDRVRNLVLIALELTTPASFLTGCLVLLHRNSPQVFGICPMLQKYMTIPPAVPTAYSLPTSSALVPSFHSLLGTSLSLDRASISRIRAFVGGLRSLPLLPPSAAVSLSWLIITVYCLSWVLVLIGSLAYFWCNPAKFRMSKL